MHPYPSLTVTEPLHAFTATVVFDRWDSASGKAQWRYLITADGVEVTGTDLRTPNDNMGAALAALLDFLGSYAESVRYPDGDNADLFPATLRPWAEAVDPDFLSLLSDDIAQDD